MASILDLPFMKRKEAGKEEPGSRGAPATPEPSEEELKLQLYKLIIDRYRDKIEEYETKSVSDLKDLVQPRNEKIAELRESICAGFHPYVYGEHFPAASKMAFEFVSSFRTLPLPVSFWLSFEEMQELMAGDEIDKSILLCSLLRALG